jgi:ABC-type Mn2+/Zn2+ transport system permease subunit
VIFVAKGFQAIGIASVLLGLIQGIQKDDMWTELYLSILGIFLFLLGWAIQKLTFRRQQHQQSRK